MRKVYWDNLFELIILLIYSHEWNDDFCPRWILGTKWDPDKSKKLCQPKEGKQKKKNPQIKLTVHGCIHENFM